MFKRLSILLLIASCSNAVGPTNAEDPDIVRYYDVRFEVMSTDVFSATMNRHINFCRWNDFSRSEIRVLSTERRLEGAKKWATFKYVRPLTDDGSDMCEYQAEDKRCLKVFIGGASNRLFSDSLPSQYSIPKSTSEHRGSYLYLEYYLDSFRIPTAIGDLIDREIVDRWIVDAARVDFNVTGFNQECDE